MQQCWAHWSNLLGLKENPTKAQYFHPSIKGRREFLDSRVSQDKVTDRPCVLGCHLQGLVRRQLCDKETKRLQDAATKVRKLCRLPVPQARKQRIAAAAPVAKAKHGWIEKLPPQSAFKIVERAVNQLCDEPKNTAPHLRRLYRSHRIDAQSRVLQNLVDMAIRHVRSSGAACPCPWSHWHGWSGNIHRLLGMHQSMEMEALSHGDLACWPVTGLTWQKQGTTSGRVCALTASSSGKEQRGTMRRLVGMCPTAPGGASWLANCLQIVPSDNTSCVGR